MDLIWWYNRRWIHFAVDGPFDDVIKGEPSHISKIALLDALSNLHKDTQGGILQFALKDAIEVALALHMWLHLLVHKSAQNNSWNVRPDGAPEGPLEVGFIYLFTCLFIYLFIHEYLYWIKMSVLFTNTCTIKLLFSLVL